MRRESFRPEVQRPLTLPIKVKIEQGTIEWKGDVVLAERITSYQPGKRGRMKQVGHLVRRVQHGRTEVPDVPTQLARTFVPNKEEQ